MKAADTERGQRYKRAGAQSAVMHYYERHTKEAVEVWNEYAALIARDGEGALCASAYTLFKRLSFLWDTGVILMLQVDLSSRPSTGEPFRRERAVAVPANEEFERVA
jgi:hypothetical protein